MNECGSGWLEDVEAGAVDDQGGGVDEAGFGGGEEADGGGDVFGLADGAVDLFLAGADVGVVVEHGGVDGAGGDAVDADFFRFALDGEDAGEGFHGALAGGVGGDGGFGLV